MERADYYEAKAALLEAMRLQMELAARQQAAWQKATATLMRLGVESSPLGYDWDDTTWTITPRKAEG